MTAAVALAAFLVACTTTRTVDVSLPSSVAAEVQPRDRVSGTTVDGREFSFEVVSVEPDAIVGETERVARAEIARLEVTRVSPGRTAGVLGGSMLLVMGLVVLAFFAVGAVAVLGATP